MRWLLKKIADVVFWPILRIKVVQFPDFPKDRGAVISVNHIHALDPIIISYVLFPNWMHHMAKEEIFRVPIVAQIVTALGAIPVNRQQPRSDSGLKALDRLEQNMYICIFPQGTRRKTEFGEIKKGAARLALNANVPIYPAAITGLENVRFWGLFRRPQVKILFGEPISVAGRENTKEEVERLNQELHNKMVALYQQIKNS